MSDGRDGKAPEEDFAAMLAESERAQGRGARGPRFAVGDRVKGKVVSIGQEVTILELAGGGEGTLDTLELQDDKGQLSAAIGATVEARVVRMGDRPGFVYLARGAGGGAEWRGDLATAVQTGLPVEGVVTAVNKGGVEVDLHGVRAFCPISQLELRQVADASVYVGRRMTFRVTRYEEDRRGPNVVLSRRALLEEEMQVRAAETRGKLSVGAVLSGVVVAIKDFGAFVDVGGIEGLLPASEIGFQRGARPSDFLTVGQPVTVQVLRIEKRDDPRRPEQVSFSLKALERDPVARRCGDLARGDDRSGRGDARRAVRRVRRGGAGGRGTTAHQRAGRRQPPAAPRARGGQAGRFDRGRGAGDRLGEAPHLPGVGRPRGRRRRRGTCGRCPRLRRRPGTRHPR